MKILLASSSLDTFHKVNSLFKEHSLDFVETGEDLFSTLEINAYDCLITDAQLIDTDIWSMARHITLNIKAIKGERLPIFLIDAGDETHTTLLAANHDIKTLDLSQPINIEHLISSERKDKPSILLIEDNMGIAKGMRITLEKAYEVDVCHSGEEGVLCWKKKKHELILLDLMLSGSSGEDVLHEIRAINPSQYIVIVSARSERDIQQKLILLGANDYLTKPFSPIELNKICRVALTQAMHQGELRIKENTLDRITSELFLVLEELENDETDNAIEIINRMIDSMPDKGVNEDSRLDQAMQR